MDKLFDAFSRLKCFSAVYSFYTPTYRYLTAFFFMVIISTTISLAQPANDNIGSSK